ncbi:ATP cone domain-containing protein [Clostridium sp. K04]|jgi:transcriptional repressor NrdR|uniref:ATP cone domain-containing protein n=1 Tax=Clostridium sp. K04 TaxID=2718929 RepID=UPI001C8B3438|nr:ATP cone domain-containing protein [Clostridium sp. K04]MBX9185270.1 hypothetical protein [Clostridium sp. K04]
MYIKKKDNRLEKFDIEKLERSIKNSANDIKFELNISDLKLLSNEVIKKLKLIHEKDSITNSYEVIGLTIEILKENRFDLIIPSYLNLI